MKLEPVSDALGVEASGVRIAELDENDFTILRDAWLAHGVLLVREQQLSDPELVAFSRRFGELDIAPSNENGTKSIAGCPQILVISNVIENGVEIGSLGSGEAEWHTDMNYLPVPPDASALYALEVPEHGGDTSFCNMQRALESLPRGLRERVTGLGIKHDSSTNSAGYLRAGKHQVDDVVTSDGMVHPIVRMHPQTGRQMLYLGRRRHAYVQGLGLEDSEKLLDALWAHATQPAFQWSHHWRVGDLLMWDNRSVMHRRDAFDPSARRIMHRTQIQGSHPVS
jgi:taurine dioxygenase